MNKIPFSTIAGHALARARELLPAWFPAGKFHGDEFHIGDASGEAGDSLKFNIRKGVGTDFATGQAFGDIIDLYAALHNMTEGDAAKRLAAELGLKGDEPVIPRPAAVRHEMELPPIDADISLDAFTGGGMGLPSAVYAYRNPEGRLRHVIARYEEDASRGRRRKEFRPYTWANGGWIARGWPKPRPLYGAEMVKTYPGKAALIVEGEKCADAARQVWPGRPVITWQGGAQGVQHADWSEMAGVPEVVILPDADEPGVMAATEAAEILHGMGIKVSIVDVSEWQADITRGHKPSGFDIADFFASGCARREIQEWVKARKRPYPMPDAAPPPDELEAMPEPEDDESLTALWERLGVKTKKGGDPYDNLDNVARVIADMLPPDRLHYDSFLNEVRVLESGAWAKLRDDHISAWTLKVQRQYGIPFAKPHQVQECVMLLARQRIRSCVREWIAALEWDGTPRLERLFVDGFGATDTEWHRIVSRNFLISLVARAMRPGCKVDTMPVLSGPQGVGKSSGLEALVAPYYADIDAPFGSREHAESIRGKLIIEISELSAMRAADVEKIKSGITRAVDVYREPWARLASDHPRQLVYVGTTNADRYLIDDTGNRRFWPVQTGTIRKDWIVAHREQLLAEARVALDSGSIWWDVPADLAAEATGERMQIDAIDESVETFCRGRPGDPVSVKDFLEWLDMPVAQWTPPMQKRVCAAFRKWGYHQRRDRGGRLWHPPDAEMSPLATGVFPLRGKRAKW